MIAEAETILRVCGIDSYLHAGCGHSKLVFDLLKRSINAYGIDASPDVIMQKNQRAPDRFFQGSLNQFPFQNVLFGTVIIGADLFALNNEELFTALQMLQKITKNNLVLYFSPEVLRQKLHRTELMSRLFWEKMVLYTGFRRHPRAMLATPYTDLEDEHLGKLVFFEKIPEASQAQYGMDWLLARRSLQNDMLRETGRRADASIARYQFAANKVRPGDVVLDVGCGLGYGTAVLAATSPGSRFIGVDVNADAVAYAKANYAATNPMLSYEACEATELAFLPNHSVDTIVAFDIIEHVPDHAFLLAELRRVLKPDGKFIGSVRNNWCDDACQDPNPFHFHRFDWEKWRKTAERFFLVEDRWAQVAGGGKKNPSGRRMMVQVGIELPDSDECEWWIISACANPHVAKQVEYTNPFHKDIATAPIHVQFEKYYDNPWLYRMMVQLGERITDRGVLTNYCVKVAKEARAGSAEQGAALCVIAYQMLESGCASSEDVMTVLNLMNTFIDEYDRTNLHSYRWDISLHYVGARLLLMLGKLSEAKETFLICAGKDPLSFSPLLATKTISARMYVGLLYLGEGDIENAKQQLRLGVQEAHRVMQGDWHAIVGDLNNPLPFGLQEAAEVLDIASQCAQTLHAIDHQGSAAGYVWDKVNLKRFGLVEWNKSLERENEMLRRQVYQSREVVVADKV